MGGDGARVSFFSVGIPSFSFLYRAPELFEVPSHCDIDEKTDVWSLGCTLFAMAYGKETFTNPLCSY